MHINRYYTLKQNKVSLYKRRVFSTLRVASRRIYLLSFYLTKISRRLYGYFKVKEDSVNHLPVSFTITKVVLLDRNICRYKIKTLGGDEYFLYQKGDFKEKYLENKGNEVPFNEKMLILAAAGRKEWVEI